MHTLIPTYYKNFKCIADKCRHSCCIGWEIDIDSNKLNYYNSLSGKIALYLKENIDLQPEPHFILKEGDRCPFLKDNGLCHLICELGEEALCDICADHPRFRNFFSGGVEMGLGLCCEAAAEIVLKFSDPFLLEGEGDIYTTDEEKYFKNKRDKCISIMEQQIPLSIRFSQLLTEVDASLEDINLEYWTEFLFGLERLDDSWTEVLNSIKKTKQTDFANPDGENYLLPLKNLTVYFIYRHMPLYLNDGDIVSKIKFAVLGTLFIHTLAVTFEHKYAGYLEALCDMARMFSSEIEYSDENLSAVFNELMW